MLKKLLKTKSIIIEEFLGNKNRNTLILCCGLRRERDSNPWTPEEVNGFRDRPIRPLWHLSMVYRRTFVENGCKSTKKNDSHTSNVEKSHKKKK